MNKGYEKPQITWNYATNEATINHIYSVIVCKSMITILHLSNDFSCCIKCDQVEKTALPLYVL